MSNHQANTGRRRLRGTGRLFVKHGSYYGSWYVGGVSRVTRKIGPVRLSREGLTKAMAEKRLQQMMQDSNSEETYRWPKTPGVVFSVCVYRDQRLEDFVVTPEPNDVEEIGTRLLCEVMMGTLAVERVLEGGEQSSLEVRFARHEAEQDTIIEQLVGECYGV